MGVSIVFDPSWVSLAQPANLVKSVDGPRPPTDVDDTSFFVYYPEDATVLPVELRGRLAARMDPEGGVVFFDGYDALGNLTRTIDPLGRRDLPPARQPRADDDEHSRRASRGATPAADPLCDTDLVTTYQYLGGAGPL